MHGGVGNEHGREQRLRRAEPDVAHDHDGCVVVHVEEREPVDGATEDDQKGVYELEDLGEVEDVGPEEEGPSWWCFRRDADDPVDVRRMEQGRESASDGHGEGEE